MSGGPKIIRPPLGVVKVARECSSAYSKRRAVPSERAVFRLFKRGSESAVDPRTALPLVYPGVGPSCDQSRVMTTPRSPYGNLPLPMWPRVLKNLDMGTITPYLDLTLA